MNQKFEFKRKTGGIILYSMSINLILTAGLLFSRVKMSAGVALAGYGIVNLFYFGTELSKPFKIVVDQKELVLESYPFLRLIRKDKAIPLRQLECTFDYEVGVRGWKLKVFKILNQGKLMVKLSRDSSGWDEQTLSQMQEKINSLKILSNRDEFDSSVSKR